MNRRAVGVMLLTVALVALFAVPNAVGRSLTGSPMAEPIAAPPAVGQCVSAISSAPVRTGSGAPTDQAGGRTLPVARIVPCSGRVIGEVMTVTPRNTAAVGTLGEYDDAHPSCRNQVETYIGTTATAELLGVQWSKSIYVDAVTVGPDEHDRAAGRTWSACVMSAVGQSYAAPRTLKASWTTDMLPSAFGLCWAGGVVQHGVPTSCLSPHTTQQLGFGFVPGPSDSSTSILSAPDPTSVARGCTQLAASIMAVKDPTVGGALAVKVVSESSGAPYVQCTVSAVGARRLTGSVIGLGDKPLPVA